MTTQDDNLIVLQKKLAALEQELTLNVVRAERRARRNVILTFVLVLAVAGYWSYMYTQIAKVDANMVAEWAQHRTLQLAAESRPAVTQALKHRAPEVFDYLEARALETPAIISDKIRDIGLQQTQTVLDQSEPVITKVVVDGIEQAKASTKAAGFDGKDPAQMDKMIDTLVAQLHSGVKDGVDRLYAQYDLKAGEVTAYIDRLAAGRNLNPRERHLRAVIISFLAIDKKQRM